MKQQWLTFAARVDALSQRERILSFAASAALLVFAVHMLAIGPLLRKQELLRSLVIQQQNNIVGINQQIAQKLQEAEADPDAPARARLAAVRGESGRLGESLRSMQKGLVAPERVAPLLESILRANGRLKMVSVRTLPVEPLSSIGARKGAGGALPGAGGALPNPDAAAATPAPAATSSNTAKRDLLFRHGVEVTVRGSYLDMVDYMTALESLPTQLFWGKAQLDVEEYPSVRLTLTLYTLSLDEKWMKL
jgi:MSHA biogenesis protein MshJ